MIIVIALSAFVATLLGGLLALRFKDQLHLILGFSAGAVLGVAFFDLLPEALELSKQFYSIPVLTTFVALGFFLYLVLDRLVLLHHHDHGHQHTETAPERGILGAGSLSIHSFLDGVAIGLAFQISVAVGGIVAVAVLVHDFSDGINTINLILKNEGNRKTAFSWLIVDAIAPVVGVIATMFFTLPEHLLGIVLATFAGFFLYIGASDLIPESQHAHPKFLTTVMTVAGVVVLYIAIQLASF